MSSNVEFLLHCRILNNDAVSYYQIGEYFKAHQRLSTALELVVSALSSDDECLESTATFNKTQLINTKNKIANDVLGCYSMHPKHRENGIEYSESIYNAGFIFTDDIPVEVQDTVIVLLFNTALIRHKIGMHSIKISYFHSAYLLYNKCLSLFDGICDGETEEEGISFSISLMIIKAAACVNMLHLFRYGFNTVTMDSNRFMVSCFQRTMKQLHSQPKAWLYLSRPDQHFFSIELFMAINSAMNIRTAQAA